MLRAYVTLFVKITGVFFAAQVALASPEDVVINEVYYNAVGGDTGFEWVELENRGDQPIDLSSWSLDDKDGGSKPYIFPEQTYLPPKSLLVIDREESKIALNNTVDHVRLLTPLGEIYVDIEYAGVKEGKSLIVIDNGFQVANMQSPGSKTVYNGYKKEAEHEEALTLNTVSMVPHGTPITLEGIITAPPNLFAKRYFYVQLLNEQGDVLPADIQVYMQKADFPKLLIHDVVALSGTISLTGSEPRILIPSPESIYKQNKNVDFVPKSFSITDTNDTIIGSLISIEGEVVEKSGKSIYIFGENDEMRVYIQPNTDIDTKKVILGNTVQITGILSKIKTGYRLLPRSQEDIEIPIIAGLTSKIDNPENKIKERDSLVRYLIVTLVFLIVFFWYVTFSLKKRLNKHTM